MHEDKLQMSLKPIVSPPIECPYHYTKSKMVTNKCKKRKFCAKPTKIIMYLVKFELLKSSKLTNDYLKIEILEKNLTKGHHTMQQ
jgi:hypothetical protein